MNLDRPEFKWQALKKMVERAVRQSPILDIHTHLYDPAMGELLLWGIDEMLVYHYLLAEGFRHIQMPYENFWRLRKEEQAELIWKELFIEHSPVSEACRGVLTILHSLGLDPKEKDLPALRNWFQQWDPQAHITRCMELAGVHRIYMTNSPFDAAELAYWAKGWARDERFAAALRLDPLLLDWHNTAPQLAEQGYDVGEGLVEKTLQEIRRFLNEWTDIMEAHYVMVSLPPNFTYPSASDAAAILEGAVLPHCRERNLPLALMMGVERAVNPALRLAGDGVGRADLSALKNLCADFPGNRFLATALSRENQHELCVLARKFRNLHIFGCWWFTNTPSLIDEITRMRLELLGWSFTAQHSDARVLEHIIYKWQHTRETIAAALVDKYVDMAAAGWEPTFKEVQRDVWQLFGGAFEEFLGVRTVPEAAPDPIDWPE